MNNNTLDNINNTYDFSNLLVVEAGINYLIQYCYSVYTGFVKLLDDDDNKNKMLQEDKQEYMYKRGFSEEFVVTIRNKGNDNAFDLAYKTIYEFQDAVKSGKLHNVSYMRINMKLNFGRTMNGKIEQHYNDFMIIFSPYDIKFFRKSNFQDYTMTQVEDGIRSILTNKFSTCDTIFCPK